MTQKWYEVARSRDNRFIKKMDVFMFMSLTYDNAFELLYVSCDQFNRRLTRCYHGRFVLRQKGRFLVIRCGLWRKKFQILNYDENAGMIAICNRRKTQAFVLSKTLPFDKTAYDRIKEDLVKQSLDVEILEIYI